jgi:hypothetical protein
VHRAGVDLAAEVLHHPQEGSTSETLVNYTK